VAGLAVVEGAATLMISAPVGCRGGWACCWRKKALLHGSGPSLRDEEGGHMWRCRVTVEADEAGFGLLF